MNKWVKVTERLPDKDGRYLVWERLLYDWVSVAYFRNGKFDALITHWQPLPQPPRDE